VSVSCACAQVTPKQRRKEGAAVATPAFPKENPLKNYFSCDSHSDWGEEEEEEEGEDEEEEEGEEGVADLECVVRLLFERDYTRRLSARQMLMHPTVRKWARRCGVVLPVYVERERERGGEGEEKGRGRKEYIDDADAEAVAHRTNKAVEFSVRRYYSLLPGVVARLSADTEKGFV
jgi:hypothetical protein